MKTLWFLAVALLCVAAMATGATAGTGPIRIARDYPHSFQYQSGERFFPMGDTAYFLIAQPTNVIARFIDTRRAHQFNFIRMMPLARGHWAFGGTPHKPDYTVINEPAMRKLDWVFDYAAAKGMNIELILFGYGIEQGEGLWANVTNQHFWIDSLVKRYKDGPNLFMWTVANEFERYPDGRYSYSAEDVEWVKSVAARIRRTDTTHPIGAHPSVWITKDDRFQRYGSFTQRRPQVVWPLWENSLVDLNITQNNEGVQPRTWGNFTPTQRGLTYYPTNWQGADYPVAWTTEGWDFEAAGMEDCIAEDWASGAIMYGGKAKLGKPVLNTEFGYQFEPGGETSYGAKTRQFTPPATVRKKAWKIATAGGYFAAGFRNLAVMDEFTAKEVDHFRPQQLEILYDFFTTKTEYWKLAPHLEWVASFNVLLALPGTEYVAYFPRGGTNHIELAAGDYSVEWLRAETGQYYPMSAIAVGSGSREFIPPDHPEADWVLHLRQRTAAGPPSASTEGKPVPRIEWDASTLSLIQANGGYGRIIRLKDGAWLCGFDFRRSIWVRRSRDEGKTWEEPVRVADWPFGGLTNTELLQLRDGLLLCFYNERPRRGQTNQPFAIALARSDDGGKTWHRSERLYAGGVEFGNGCWEPAAIELPSGEVQLFFSNESPYRNSDEQEITLLRSHDGARTWSAPETVSFRAGHRDGMAVPLVLNEGRGIAFAIEDNGLSGNFKPVIVFSTLEGNWRSEVRRPGDPNRWSALSELPAVRVAASAPYLRQMPSGETLLSFQQTDQTGELKTACMVVYIGDAQARDFRSPSTPFPMAGRNAQLWNSLFVKNSHTVVAVSQTTINGVSGIWSVEGKLIRK